MSITYGFFNSYDGDRTYNADQMSMYFKGLVASNGVFEQTGGAFRVEATTGLAINVLSGRALINSRWVDSDAVETINLNPAHITLNRYTAIVLELNSTNREITLKAVDGDNATTPVKPAIINTAEIKQLCLAYIYVAAGAENITQANITDTRPSNLCGWITGLINQVDTSTLFSQWQNAYEQYFAQMQGWKNTQQTSFEAWEAAQKVAFDAWFDTLTEELQVNTYIVEFNKNVTLTQSSSRNIPLDMLTYTYNEKDVIFVAFNGFVAELGTDYTIDTSGQTVNIVVSSASFAGVVDIKVLKSKIGIDS